MNSKLMLIAGLAVLLYLLPSCNKNQYRGTAYTDLEYTKGIQTLPGRLECEYYDTGGEGISFHDTDTINSGSGRLNPQNGSYLHAFRENESVDISYVKFGQTPAIDDNPYNTVEPNEKQLYVGWTEPGEWINYTVRVKKTGKYRIGLMYTANQDGQISLSVDGIDATGPIPIPNTFVAADTVAWRQWHHWNYLNDMASLKLKKGIHILSLHTLQTGQMNYEHINFILE